VTPYGEGVLEGALGPGAKLAVSDRGLPDASIVLFFSRAGVEHCRQRSRWIPMPQNHSLDGPGSTSPSRWIHVSSVTRKTSRRITPRGTRLVSVDSSTLYQLALAIGAAGVVAAIVGIIEFYRESRRRRIELFLQMRHRFKENPVFVRICGLLDFPTKAAEVRVLSFEEKRELLGFFEEVALLTNGHIISKRVANYMFGYYAIRCWKSDDFWWNINRDSYYWSLFRNFVENMEAVERKVIGKGGKINLKL